MDFTSRRKNSGCGWQPLLAGPRFFDPVKISSKNNWKQLNTVVIKV
jgi:hypothetical protein